MAKQLTTLQREREVISILQKERCSVQTLCDRTGMQYYTARRVVEDLLGRGVIKLYDTVDRHRIFVYNADNVDEHDFIPRLTHLLSKSSTKAIFLIEGVGEEDGMKSTLAAKALPKHMVDLMMAATSAQHGADVQFRLNMIRDAMQKDMLYLKNSAYLYEQILKEPRFWDPAYLKEMPDDPDYVYTEVQKASDYYDNQ